MMNANVSPKAKFPKRISQKPRISLSYIMMKACFHFVELHYNVINQISLG